MKIGAFFSLIVALPLVLATFVAAESCGSHSDDANATAAEAKGTPAAKGTPEADGTPAAKGDAAQEPKAATKSGSNPMVVFETNYGNIKIELFKDKAPISTENFLSYVRDGFYDATIFHRVAKGFVIQAGGFTQDMKEKPAKAAIKNEAANGLSNLRGTLSVARTNDINSGTTHFFVNLVDNKRLDHTGESAAQYGYAVFGKVAEGMDVVDKIAAVEVGNKGMHQNVPVKPAIITKARILGAGASKTEPQETKVKEKKVEEKQIGEPEAGSGGK
jgi:cyclophilin family peptidyl-prolyl cis-trans isomerase